MIARYCFWSVVDGEYAEMMKTTIRSARQWGVFHEFHAWTDRPIPEAICHQLGKFDKRGWLFKLVYLRESVSKLNYDYFVWLDADTYFVRNPGNVLRVLAHSPVHVVFESDVCHPGNLRQDWWGCPSHALADLMRQRGVRSRSIFNTNGGFWIVHHDVIETFCNLTYDFWQFCKGCGFALVDEPLLSYAAHMLCGNPYIHNLRNAPDLWASDWTGCFGERLPDGKPWCFVDYFTGEKLEVNPAIVHAMRSKTALATAAQPAARVSSQIECARQSSPEPQCYPKPSIPPTAAQPSGEILGDSRIGGQSANHREMN